MDIKLKNKHRLGIFLTWLLIIAAGAGMVCSYPYIQRMAREWETNNKKIVTEMGDQSRSSNLAAELTAASYAMWEYEIEEASVKKLRPSQVFVPELEEMLAKLDGETAETRPEAAGEEGMSEETAEETAWEEAPEAASPWEVQPAACRASRSASRTAIFLIDRKTPFSIDREPGRPRRGAASVPLSILPRPLICYMNPKRKIQNFSPFPTGPAGPPSLYNSAAV